MVIVDRVRHQAALGSERCESDASHARRDFLKSGSVATLMTVLGSGVERLAQTNPPKVRPTMEHSSLRQPGEPLVEVARESIAIRLRERWRTTADIAARTHGVHEVPHREYASDRVW